MIWQRNANEINYIAISSMIRIQTRISDGLDVLQFFTMRKWDFRYDNFVSLDKFLKGKDKTTYVPWLL